MKVPLMTTFMLLLPFLAEAQTDPGNVTCDGSQSNMWSCCSSSNLCGEGEGDCDSDSECSGNLKCGSDNCIGFEHSTADCCFMPDNTTGYLFDKMADDLDLVFCACDEQTYNGVTNGTDGLLNRKEFMANKCQNIINNMFDYQFTSDVFTTMDANGDGQCNKTEFTSQWMHFGSLKALPEFLAVPTLNSLVCTCDTDKNAKLSKNELGTPKGKIVQKWVLGKILSSFEFNFLDKDNDGFIDVPEFNQALASLGAKTTTPPPPTAPTSTPVTTTTTTTTTTTKSSESNCKDKSKKCKKLKKKCKKKAIQKKCKKTCNKCECKDKSKNKKYCNKNKENCKKNKKVQKLCKKTCDLC